MDVVGAIMLGWMLAGFGVVLLLNVVKTTLQYRSLRTLQLHPGEASPATRRTVEPTVRRPPAPGGRDPLIHVN